MNAALVVEFNEIIKSIAFEWVNKDLDDNDVYDYYFYSQPTIQRRQRVTKD